MTHHCDLHKAFEEQSLEKFIEALEVFEVDPNAPLDGGPRTVFEKILSTPNSACYIQKCIEYGADFNVVSNPFHFFFLLMGVAPLLCLKHKFLLNIVLMPP